MVTRSFFFLLLLAASTLAATLQRVPNPDTLSRERRQYLGQYSGSSSFSGVDGGVPYGGGTYSVGSLGPQGFVGYTGNFGNPFNNFVTPNLFPAVPYIANNPFDVSSLYNAYFNALQAQQQNLQNQLIQLSSDAAAAPAAPQLSTRQITLGPARPPITLPGVLQPGSGQIGQLVTSYQQTLRGALCRALQRLQVSWAETASVCSGIASGNQAGGLLSINTANSRPGGASITISAPPDAQIQPITGVQSGSQGHLIVNSGSSKPGAATISIIAPSAEQHQIQEISEGLGTRGQGLVTITKNGVTRPKGGATITISAPSDAQIQQIKGPDGNVQGVTVTHQGPDNGGNYVGSFSSSSSSSSNVNGETQSQQSSTLGINNNGLTTFISSHSR